MADAVMIAAPSSGSGKTVVTLGLLGALRKAGVNVASAKAGPDYIDPRFHEAATGRPCYNLDPWAMRPALLSSLMTAEDAGLLVIEAVMGLFDGPDGDGGSSADLAARFGIPVILVVDCSHQAQSVAALVQGFAAHRRDVRITGVILNRVASSRHEALLRSALEKAGVAVVGALHRGEGLALPSRHLGLVQASEHAALEDFLETASIACEAFVAPLRAAAQPIDIVSSGSTAWRPLGQRVAIARDQAFAFSYPHVLNGWRGAGADLSFFSPLANEAPRADADAIYLPGGYPELYAGALACNSTFLNGLRAAAARGAVIYGECGGYMVLGRSLIDEADVAHAMAGLLPVDTSFAKRALHLGYRQLKGAAPLPQAARGHEFHYSTIAWQGDAAPLFEAKDAAGRALGPMGQRVGTVMGSYAHIIAERAP